MSIKEKLYNYKLKINCKKNRSTAIYSTPILIFTGNIADLTYPLQ